MLFLPWLTHLPALKWSATLLERDRDRDSEQIFWEI